MYIDLHSDSIFCLTCFTEEVPATLEKNDFMIDASRIRENGVWQAFALYVPLEEKYLPGLSPWEKLNKEHDRFVEEMTASAIPRMKSCRDLESGYGAILTTEEGASLEGDLSRLATLASWGVKSFGFTWNYENELGYPNSRDARLMAKGLKTKGFEAVEECERLGILVDVSHLSDGGFWDVVKTARKPFVATHSNARALLDHPRNLSDGMIRALAEKGGVTGLNFCPLFVSSTNKGEVSALADHVEHILDIGGEDVLSIGTDFDGYLDEAEIHHPGEMHLLFRELERRGISSRVLEKIQWGNALRVFKEAEE